MGLKTWLGLKRKAAKKPDRPRPRLSTSVTPAIDIKDPKFRASIEQVDICIVAGRRPDLLEKTLTSFDAKLFRNFRIAGVYANIDPIFGDEDDHIAAGNVIRSFFPYAEICEPARADFCTAVQTNWTRTKSDFLFHIEDDWLLNFDITPELLIDFADPSIAQISFNMQSKNWRPEEHGEFHYIKKKRRDGSYTFGLPAFGTSPSFLRASFARKAASLLDTDFDPEKQFFCGANAALEAFASTYRVKMLSHPAMHVVTDIGREWRDRRGIAKIVLNGTSTWSAAWKSVV